MQWFKHHSSASRELSVRSVREKYNFHGLGVLWTMVERVVETNGLITEDELCHEFASRKFGRSAVKDLIHGFGIFSVDKYGYVRCLLDGVPETMNNAGGSKYYAPDTAKDAVVSKAPAHVTSSVKASKSTTSAAAPDVVPAAAPDVVRVSTLDMTPDTTPDSAPDMTPDSVPVQPSNTCARIEKKENKKKNKNKRECMREPGQKPWLTECVKAALLASARSEQSQLLQMTLARRWTG